jgi:hypothetical protein
MPNGSSSLIEQKYSKLNTIIGWCVFAIAVFVYWSTVEPTASFWDCSENLAVYYKLEIGHPPGEPLLQIYQHIVTLLSFGDPQKVAPIVNRSCGVFSSFTILFLFWITSFFAKKAMTRKGELTESTMYAVLGSAFVGAVSFIFADSFWFSATEASVWSASLFFSTLMFWCATKMYRSDEPERWVVFIAYLVGLSIGVHMLCILVIPAVVFLYFYRDHQNNNTPKWVSGLLKMVTKDEDKQKLLAASVAAIILLGSVKSLVIPGLIAAASRFEIFFVNTIGLPFNGGVIIYGLTIAALVIWGLSYAKKNNKPGTHSAVMCIAVLFLGYSTYIMIVVRANANPPLNEGAPSNTLTLKDYLDRKQYGDFPSFYGEYYTAPIIDYNDDGPVYVRDEKKGKYVVSYENQSGKYAPEFCGIFAREWDGSESHPHGYRSWGGTDFDKIPYTDAEGNKQIIDRPKFFSNNLRYFFNYQLGFMYFRYLLWDFCGRQNDIQGLDPADNLHGNWITGIPFIDGLKAPRENMPDELGKNKARNAMYAIPLLFGLLGFFYHYKKDPKRFTIVLVMFFFTGIAIILFLNQKPYEPRERDYSYVGSFFTFAIWIGLGVLALFDIISEQLKADENRKKMLAILTTVVCLGVPALMAHAEWDDHDRSKRTTTRDFAIDYLQSCPPNAILFADGDNDTFPLWYAQEVEGIRTDVRVCNLELLGMSWYVDQMNHKAYTSDRMPFSLTHDQYRDGTRDYLIYYDAPNGPFHRYEGQYCNLAAVIDFIKSDNDADKIELSNEKMANYLPTKKFKIAVDKEAVIKSGIIAKDLDDSIPSEISWDFNGNNITRSTLMVLDAIAHNNWKRPLCFAVTSGSDAFLGLQKYFQLQGMVFLLTPIKDAAANTRENPRVGVDQMYDNMMSKFRWGNMGSGIYLDENIRRMATELRYQACTLSDALLGEHKKDSAIKVLNLCMDSISAQSCPYDGSVVMLDRCYFEAGDFSKADSLAKNLFGIFEKDLIYYNTLTGFNASYYSDETKNFELILDQLAYYSQQYKQTALMTDFQAKLENLNKLGLLKGQQQ